MRLTYAALFYLLASAAVAQPNEWGPKCDHIHFGLVVKDGAYGLLCEVYAEYTGPKKSHRMALRREVNFELRVFDERYRAVPTSTVAIRDSSIFRGLHSGPPKEWDYGIHLKRNEPALVAHYVIERPESSWDRSCYALREWQHTVKADMVFPHWNAPYDTLRTSTAPVRVTYCEEENFARKHQEEMDRFFHLLVQEQNPHTLQLCIAMVQDTAQDKDMREAAMRHLRDANSQRARDVLHAQCLVADPELPYLLDAVFETLDPRGLDLIDRYAKSTDETMQVYLVSGIAGYKSVEHLPIVRRIAETGTRWARGAAVDACRHINADASREILYEALHDPDLGLRTNAVRNLAEIGNAGSLKEVLGYLEREDPNNVGYVATGWETAEKLSGMDFGRDLARLRVYVDAR